MLPTTDEDVTWVRRRAYQIRLSWNNYDVVDITSPDDPSDAMAIALDDWRYCRRNGIPLPEITRDTRYNSYEAHTPPHHARHPLPHP